MVYDMMVNDIMEEMSTDEPEASIDCAKSTFLEGPGGGIVMRNK